MNHFPRQKLFPRRADSASTIARAVVSLTHLLRCDEPTWRPRTGRAADEKSWPSSRSVAKHSKDRPDGDLTTRLSLPRATDHAGTLKGGVPFEDASPAADNHGGKCPHGNFAKIIFANLFPPPPPPQKGSPALTIGPRSPSLCSLRVPLPLCATPFQPRRRLAGADRLWCDQPTAHH